MQELSRAPEILNQGADANQASSNALVREAQLIWQGVSATPEHLQKAFDAENRGHTIQTALLSAGVTFALTCLKRSPSLSWTAGRIVVPALSVPLLTDLNARAGIMGDAMADTWNSGRNWQQNVAVSRETIGRFTADFAISSVASGFAEAAGRSYFGLRTPGVNKLPELSREGILANWQKHMDGEIVPYKIYSAEGGGMRQVDLFLPQNLRLAHEGVGGTKNIVGENSVASANNSSGAAGIAVESSAAKRPGLLIAQEGLKLDFGRLKNLELPDMGLINLRADKSMDYVAAFTHPHRARVLPGVNISAWRHESGLIKEGGLFAPRANYTDTAFITDVERSLTSLFKTDRTVLAGYSSGAILANEVAAKLGPNRVHAVVSVASTVTGLEPAAAAGQFRLIVRDHGDPTLLQQGGAGGKAKVLGQLGHKSVFQSAPENQLAYALKPYESQALVTRHHDFSPVATVEHVGHADGAPIATQIKTSVGKHAWTPRSEFGPKPTLSPHVNEQLDLNLLVRDIVNGNLQRFRVTPGL